MTRRAFEDGKIEVQLWPLRDFADDPHPPGRRPPYGGGPGMVMLGRTARARTGGDPACPGRPGAAGPLHADRPAHRPARGRGLRIRAGAILLCGRYEGIDQRFIERHVDLELSLGDFVLSGGELPALALLDAVARLQDGVLGDPESHRQDSFADGLLDCPHYSRPEALIGEHGAVPEALLSGNHAAIARWRRERALEMTARLRPDLIEAARAAGRLDSADERYLASLPL